MRSHAGLPWYVSATMAALRSIITRPSGLCGVVAFGRKNYLLRGIGHRGGERAATFYSLIGTAKLNGLDPKPISARC